MPSTSLSLTFAKVAGSLSSIAYFTPQPTNFTMHTANVFCATQSHLDSDYRKVVAAGGTIKDVIENQGSEFGYHDGMVVIINNVPIYDYHTVVQPGVTVVFREGTKERG